MARVVVDVMLKPEILDPQGQAVLGALGRLGLLDALGATSVRQGKHFEIELTTEPDADQLARIEEVAGTLLANPVIEDYVVRAG